MDWSAVHAPLATSVGSGVGRSFSAECPSPDAVSLEALGHDVPDPARRSGSAHTGLVQGRKEDSR